MDKKNYEQDVIHYYDRNTHQFLFFGHGRMQQAIHRAVFAPGVRTRNEAMQYVNEQIYLQTREAKAGFILDLGCGVGGSMLYLAQRLSSRMVGVTISDIQADLGEELIDKHALHGRLSIEQGSYLDPELFTHVQKKRGEDTCVVYAIESFIHAASLDKLLKNITLFCRAEDLLIVCDDFLSATAEERSKKADRKIERFRLNWKANALTLVATFINMVSGSGFDLIEDRNLTPYLELGRPRDKLIRPVAFLAPLIPFRPPWLENWIGGDALQYCLRHGIIEYHYMVFRRSRPHQEMNPE